MLEYFLSFLILTGAIFTFIGSLGLLRLKDLFTRLHGPTKATTLGVGCLLIASAIYFSAHTETISFHEVLITLFLFITAPISAHLLAKAALHLELKSIAKIPEDDEPDDSVVETAATNNPNGSAKVTESVHTEETAETHHENPLKQ